MDITSVKKLYLTFFTDQNKTHTIVVDKPVYPADEASVKAGMDLILSNEAIITKKGKLVSIKEAKFVTRDVEGLDLSLV
jgi:hypothetical protein